MPMTRMTKACVITGYVRLCSPFATAAKQMKPAEVGSRVLPVHVWLALREAAQPDGLPLGPLVVPHTLAGLQGGGGQGGVLRHGQGAGQPRLSGLQGPAAPHAAPAPLHAPPGSSATLVEGVGGREVRVRLPQGGAGHVGWRLEGGDAGGQAGAAAPVGVRAAGDCEEAAAGEVATQAADQQTRHYQKQHLKGGLMLDCVLIHVSYPNTVADKSWVWHLVN